MRWGGKGEVDARVAMIFKEVSVVAHLQKVERSLVLRHSNRRETYDVKKCRLEVK
jgi:hypothetical protein